MTSPSALDRLNAHWRLLTEGRPGWWEACTELRTQHDAIAADLLHGAIAKGRLDRSSVEAVVFHASRDLSRTTGKAIGQRYGLTFALHLPNMGWIHDARLDRVSAALLALDRGDIDQALAPQTELSCFVFVTLAAFLLQPQQGYLPWIAAVHNAVEALTAPLPRRAPDPAAYEAFLQRTQALTAPLEGCTANMLDQLLYGAADPDFDPGPRPSLPPGPPAFGAPIPATSDAEPRLSSAVEADLERTLAGYRGLGARYAAFLEQAARCRRCAADTKIPVEKQPIPALVGRPASERPERYLRAGAALESYRREDGSIRYQPDDPTAPAELERFLDAWKLSGLFIGQCGWSDLAARVRGPETAAGCKLMLLGNDWYPLTRCANFFTERHELDNNGTLSRFLRQLERARYPDTPRRKLTTVDLERFIREERIYLGNALSCFRTGWATTGAANLHPRSFENCAPLVEAHLEAVRPAVLVTFGANSTATVAGLVRSDDQATEDTLAALRQVHRGRSLGAVMAAHYAGQGTPAALRVTLGSHALRFIPLYHPSFAHLNKYDHDYEVLARTLAVT
jgi:uracil-DNA glycosylase